MLPTFDWSPQLSVALLIGILVFCWAMFRLGQDVAELIIEWWASFGRYMDVIDAALELPTKPDLNRIGR